MPFTPSHIAAVLPFARTPLPAAALVLGAMVPDLFYYLPLGVPRAATHSWIGVLTIDLIFAILLFLLWKAVFRAPVLDAAPRWVRTRMGSSAWLPTTTSDRLRLIGLVVAAVLLGSATHVLWDSVTHAGPTVDTLGLGAMLGPLPLYKWGQHASSLIGIVAVVFFIEWWRRTATPHSPAPTRLNAGQRLGAIILVAGSGLVVALVIWIRGIVGGASPIENSLIFTTVTVGLAAAGLVAVLLSIVWWLRGR